MTASLSSALAAADELELLETSTRPALLLSEDGTSLLWANRTAADFAGFSAVDDLLAARFQGTPFAAQMEMLRRNLHPGSQRLELLRMPAKTGVLSFVGKVRLTTSGARTGLLIIGPETKPKVPPTAKILRPATPVAKPKKTAAPKKAGAAKKKKEKKREEKLSSPPVPQKAVSLPKLEPHERESLAAIARALGEAKNSFPAEHELPSLSEPQTETIAHLEAQNGKLQEQLHQAHLLSAELQTILDTATDGVLILDRYGRVLNMNRPAEALLGVSFEQHAGLKLTDLLDPASHEAALAYLHDSMQDGALPAPDHGREVTGFRQDGEAIPLFMTLDRLGKHDREPRFCAVLRDITQWKHAEAGLIAARKRAEAASEQKSDFLAKMSHEIRTPLNAIIGFSEVMLEERFGSIGNERYKQYLGDIRASGGFLLSLVNDLLDLSKIEAGKLDLTFAPVYLNDIVLQGIGLLQAQANRGGVILRSSLQDLPPVVADARSIRQILLNLLSNAIRFTPEGGQIIVSTATTENGDITLRVRDTGIGMTQAEIALALEPFRQIKSDQEKEDGKGTGLGLPISKALTEANRALFDIESTPKKGTLISITFPHTRVLGD